MQPRKCSLDNPTRLAQSTHVILITVKYLEPFWVRPRSPLTTGTGSIGNSIFAMLWRFASVSGFGVWI